MHLNISRNQELLLCCSRLELHSSQRKYLGKLLTNIKLSWVKVLRDARWHRVSALLYHNLRVLDQSDSVPTDVMRQLKSTYHQTLANNLALRSELRNILDALHSKGIPVAVLKGAALVEEVYGSIGLRPMRDLDILVPSDEAAAAFSAIQELGYSAKEGVDRQRQRSLFHQHYSQLFGTDQASVVEIHTHILEVQNPLRFSIAGFWNRAIEVDIAGTRALTLAPEDLLTHLAIHFFKDRRSSSYSALGQLCDIALVTRHYESDIDWPLLLNEVTTNGLNGPVFLGLYLAKELLDAPVPDAVLDDLKPDGFRQRDAERFIRRRVFGREVRAKGLIAPNDSYKWRSVPSAIVKRVFPKQQERLAQGDNQALAELTSYSRHFYLQRIGTALAAAADTIAHPIRAFEDIASDRWLHSLYSERRTDQNIKRGQTVSTERIAQHDSAEAKSPSSTSRSHR